MIQGKLGVSTKELKLVFANQLLEDGRTLSDYNIQDGATVYIGGVNVHIPLLLYCSLVPSPSSFSMLLYWFCPLYISVGSAIVIKVITKLL